MRHWLFLPILLLAFLARTQAAVPVINGPAEVSAFLYAASATRAANEKVADSRIRADAMRIASLEKAVKAGGAKVADLIAAQDAYVDRLAQRDHAYAAEIAVLRDAAMQLIASPERAAALAMYNKGDRVAALAVLDTLRTANDAARKAKASVASAEEARPNAALALDARGKSDPAFTTAAVIARYEEITRLDPTVFWDWVNLCRLYRDAGRLTDARRAAEQAAKYAQTDRDRAGVLVELRGDVLTDAGDFGGARKACEEGLTIARRLSAADPANAAAQRDVAVALNRMGNVQLAAGDLGEAGKAFLEVLAITRRLSAADPGNDAAQLDVVVALDRVGDVLVTARNFGEARNVLIEGLAMVRRLSAANTSNTEVMRDLMLSLQRLGVVFVAEDDLGNARSLYEESVVVARYLSQVDPTKAAAQRDVAGALDRVGSVLMAAGDLAGARKNYEESLAIRRRLSAADPGNADAQRDLVTSFQNLAVIPGSSIHWSDVVAQLEAMKAKGTLAPAGEKVLEFARGLSAADSGSAVAQRDVAGAALKKSTMLVAVGDYGGARKAFEEGLTIARGLSAADPSNVAAQRGVATLLDNMASLLIAMGDQVGARKALEEDLVIARRLSAADPTNAAAQSIVSVALNKLGGVLVAGNDISGARKAYEESLGIVRRLSSAEPTNAEAQRDVAVSLWGLARIPGSGVRWSDVVAQMETMKSKGILNPADEKFIEQARQNAAKQNMP